MSASDQHSKTWVTLEQLQATMQARCHRDGEPDRVACVIVDTANDNVVDVEPNLGMARVTMNAQFDTDPAQLDRLTLVELVGGRVEYVDWPRPETSLERAREFVRFLNEQEMRGEHPDGRADISYMAHDHYLRANDVLLVSDTNGARHAFSVTWIDATGDVVPVGLAVEFHPARWTLLADERTPKVDAGEVAERLAAAVNDATGAAIDPDVVDAIARGELDRRLPKAALVLAELAVDVARRFGLAPGDSPRAQERNA